MCSFKEHNMFQYAKILQSPVQLMGVHVCVTFICYMYSCSKLSEFYLIAGAMGFKVQYEWDGIDFLPYKSTITSILFLLLPPFPLPRAFWTT